MPLNSARNGNTRRKLEPKCVSQLFLGSSLETRLSAIGQKSLQRTEDRGFWNPQLMKRAHGAPCDEGATDWHFFPSIETSVGLFSFGKN